jgi:2-haloacid dehalogenase
VTRTSWFLFDAYGTLLDVESAGRACDPQDLPPGVTSVWRAKQLEYTWTSQAMGAYRDFEVLTAEALEYALSATGARRGAREGLRHAYLELEPFPETLAVLKALRDSGLRLAVLSNGTAAMLATALDSAGICPFLDDIISVDEISTYKPVPRAYSHAIERLGAEPSEIRFVSANAWDAAGAQRAGLDATWINREGRPGEYGLVTASGERQDLRRLLTTLH